MTVVVLIANMRRLQSPFFGYVQSLSFPNCVLPLEQSFCPKSPIKDVILSDAWRRNDAPAIGMLFRISGIVLFLY